MSAAVTTRFVVNAFDYDLWQVVVEAESREAALRKAQAIYDTDSFGDRNTLAHLDRTVRWSARPLVGEVRL